MGHLFSLNDFPNLLPSIPFTAKQIAAQIKPFHLTFPPKHDNTVEWHMDLPMFVLAFYDYVIKNNKIPDQEQFYSYYLEMNKAFFDAQNFDNNIYEGIKARAYRAYPSLVRDICFNKYVSEQLPNCEVIYNLDLDIKEGIDLLISKNATFYAVSLYIKTQRAYVGRKAKENRHIPFSNVKYVEFPVDFNGSFKCGYFFLYGKREFNKLLNVLK